MIFIGHRSLRQPRKIIVNKKKVAKCAVYNLYQKSLNLQSFLVASVALPTFNSNFWFEVAFSTLRWNQWAIASLESRESHVWRSAVPISPDQPSGLSLLTDKVKRSSVTTAALTEELFHFPRNACLRVVIDSSVKKESNQ